MADTFFDSEIVKGSLEDIMDLQMEVLLFAEYGAYATAEDQRKNIKNLRLLLAKQKNMFFRCMLSDSQDAKDLMSEIMDHFKSFGHVCEGNPLQVFDSMEEQIDEIESEYNERDEPGGETPPSIM